jgi:phage/plasmid-like protein (TIGR03299 family)
MAHEIDFSTGDAGFAQFGDRVTAWHGHGRAINVAALQGLTTQQVIDLVLEQARLNWTVEPMDVYDVHGRLIDGWKSFERSDTNARMGIFPESYTVMQNRTLLTLVEPLLDAGMVTWETAGSLRGGEDVWFLLKFNPNDPAIADWFAQNGTKTYALLANNHSRKRLLSIMETMVQVVCANTLGAALGNYGRRRRAGRYPGAVLLRHTKNVKSLSVAAVNDLWSTITERYGKVQESYVRMQARFLSEEEFEKNVLDLVAPLPEPTADSDGRFDAALARAADKRGVIRTLYAGAGRGIDGSPTAWNAYMATTEAIDHFPDTFKTRVDRLQATFPGGSLANKKQDVLNALDALASS